MTEYTPSRSLRSESASGGIADGLLATIRRHERAVWGLMVLGLVLDSVLTYYGLRNGMVEANPFVRASLEAFGQVGGVIAPKTGALFLALGGTALVATRHRVVVPLALAVPWLLAAGINFAGLFVL